MITIDPSIRHQSNPNTKRMSIAALANSELSSMSALQEKRDTYLQEASHFIDRIKQFMDMTFGAALIDTKDTIDRRRATGGASTNLSVEDHDVGRRALWQLSPLMLFVKEIDTTSWEGILQMYQARAHPIYQKEIRDNIQLWKRTARKPTGEEQEILFTYNEKEPEGLTSTARKLTVKRSQTLARSLRTASNEKISNASRTNIQTGGLWAFEVFSGVLEETTPLISAEQNFIVDFFHATGTENLDFADAVTAAPPEARKGTNLYIRKMFEPDRNMARRVADLMDELYSFYPAELQSLIDWALKADPLQGIGILSALHRTSTNYEDSNQDFLTRTVTTISTRLTGLWSKFVDEQIRAIEETKVKIKKRKGVIAFIKVFPNFSAAIENMLPPANEQPAESNEIRAMIDKAYERINKAMFESLRVIAKESPTANVSAGGPHIGLTGDPEDKEALNYHILLIENMNHYVEEVDAHGDIVLVEGKARAEEEMQEHLRLYVDAVIRRPLGKILVSLSPSSSFHREEKADMKPPGLRRISSPSLIPPTCRCRS
jgi:exocyst complex component 1